MMRRTWNAIERWLDELSPEKSRGETIVEVLLATVILSTIIAGAYTLSNRATRIGQFAIERTEAVNNVESMTETLQGVGAARGEAWSAILAEGVNSGSIDYGDDECTPSGSNHIYLDIDTAADLADQNIVNSGVKEDNFYRIWIEGYSGDNYIDFHVRACWEGIGTENMERVVAVLRINTGAVSVWGDFDEE